MTKWYHKFPFVFAFLIVCIVAEIIIILVTQVTVKPPVNQRTNNHTVHVSTTPSERRKHMSNGLTIQTWIYPASDVCDVAAQLADGRQVDVLKPQYFTLQDSGVLSQLNDDGTPQTCNGYSVSNALLVKKYSSKQFVTISGTIAGIAALDANSQLLNTFTKQLVTFLQQTQFTGVEIDVEDYSSWTLAAYGTYKHVILALGATLHSAGYQLLLDGPCIINQTYQSYFLWKYEDFANLPIDGLVAMCYDMQFDRGLGTPVSTLQDVTDTCAWMKAHIVDPKKIIIGLPTYGYIGKTGTYASQNKSYTQMSKLHGFSTATRDASSGEMMWSQGGMSYDYSDQTTINMKVQTVLKTGVNTVSLWHLGSGSPWPVTAQQPTQVPDLLAAFHQAYPAFAQFYDNTIAKNVK